MMDEEENQTNINLKIILSLKIYSMHTVIQRKYEFFFYKE